MPTWLRNLILLTVLPVWFSYCVIDFVIFHTLPPYEALLVPSATVAIVARPTSLNKVAKKVIPHSAREEDNG